MGFGVIETRDGRLSHLAHGCIETLPSTPMGNRLLDIFAAVSDLIESWAPDGAGMEALYFARNVSSALPVAEAKGVIRLAFARAGVELVEYTPNALKQAVTGSSRAEKRQVQEMVRILLGLEENPRPEHAADALAAAICRANNVGPFGHELIARPDRPRAGSPGPGRRRA